MAKQLAGKVALVTGASRGIGRAISVALAGEGATVVLAARAIEKLKETAEQADAQFNKVLLLMGPLVLGVVFSHISGLVVCCLKASYIGINRN